MFHTTEDSSLKVTIGVEYKESGFYETKNLKHKIKLD
jgi:hypothetical protein